MRRRRQSHEDLHNRERWLISYADFITLLFAFFVVMYSVSSINEGKYKVLSETMSGVFNAPQRSFHLRICQRSRHVQDVARCGILTLAAHPDQLERVTSNWSFGLLPEPPKLWTSVFISLVWRPSLVKW